MKHIRVNLATSEYQDKRILYAMFMVAAFVILTVSAYNIRLGHLYANQAFDYARKLEQLKGVQGVKRAGNGARVVKAEKNQRDLIGKQAGFVNTLIRMDMMPWDRLLGALENNVPPGMTILSLASSDDLRKVVLSGKARSMMEIGMLLRGLSESSVYESCDLANLSFSQKEGPPGASEKEAQAVRFDVECVLGIYELMRTQG